MFLGGSATEFYCALASVKFRTSSNFTLRNYSKVRFPFTSLFSFFTCFRHKPRLEEVGVGLNNTFYITPSENPLSNIVSLQLLYLQVELGRKCPNLVKVLVSSKRPEIS